MSVLRAIGETKKLIEALRRDIDPHERNQETAPSETAESASLPSYSCITTIMHRMRVK